MSSGTKSMGRKIIGAVWIGYCLCATLRSASSAETAAPLALSVGRTLDLRLTEEVRTFALSGDSSNFLLVRKQEPKLLVLTGKQPGAGNLVIISTSGVTTTRAFVVRAGEPAIKSPAKPEPPGVAGMRSSLQSPQPTTGEAAPKSPQEERIERALASIPGVTVTVQSGKIILDGRVANQLDSLKAEQIAARFTSSEVINRIKVGTAPDSTPALSIKPAVPGSFAPVPSPSGPAPTAQRIVVTQGLGKIMETQGNIVRIGFSNDAVIQVWPLGPRHVSITGVKTGVSSLYTFTELRPGDKVGVPREYLVEVVAPTGPGEVPAPPKAPEQLEREITEAIKDPRVFVSVIRDKDEKMVAILKGEVEKERDSKDAEQVALSYVATVRNQVKFTIPEVAPQPSEDEKLTNELREELAVPTISARKTTNGIALYGSVPSEEELAMAIRYATLRVAQNQNIEASAVRISGLTQPPGARRMTSGSIAMLEAQLSPDERRVTNWVRSTTSLPNVVIRLTSGVETNAAAGAAGATQRRFVLMGRVKNQQEYDRLRYVIEHYASFAGAAAAIPPQITAGGQGGGQQGGGQQGAQGGGASTQNLIPYMSFVEIEEGGFVRQVTIQANFVEISRTGAKDLGLQWGTLSGGAVTPGNLTFGEATRGSMTRLSNIGAQLIAQQSKGQAKILSQPNTTTLDRNIAFIQVGGSFPIPTTTIGGGALAQQSVTFQQFGIILVIRPEVTDDKKIFLQVEALVSQPDNSSSVVINSSRIPGLRTRQVQTALVMNPGESTGIGGLIDRVDSKTVNSTPLLTAIPFLGDLFKSRAFQRGDTELMVFLTPTLEELPASQGALDAASRFFLLPPLPSPQGGVSGSGGTGGR